MRQMKDPITSNVALSLPFVSIIVPVHIADERFSKDLEHFFHLDYPAYEIILVIDDCSASIPSCSGLTILNTGLPLTGPAEKRDLAIRQCRGDICAFIDDDAYPHPAWLRNAVERFKQESVAAVCGPGLTPPTDDFWQKAGGAVYESFLGSGQYVYRFIPRKSREVDDYPAYNLLVRKSVLEQVGGFASTFYGGEDTKLCLSIIRSGGTVFYDPTVLVYHHRRRLFREHLRQISNVGIHRGYFVKAFPETSLRPSYFLPTMFAILVICGLCLSSFSVVVRILFVLSLGSYLLVGFASIVRRHGPLLALAASLGIFATHITYGLVFLRGLSLKHLDR